MKKIELEIVALSHSVTQSSNYAVVLGEIGGDRRLPIVIAQAEAQAIAVALENMIPNRPLTHDLLKNVLLTFDIDLKEVIISNLIEGVFHARLICLKDGATIEIDSRTSDAIALAIRFDCPIYTTEYIMEAASIVMDDPTLDDSNEEDISSRKSSQQNISKDNDSLSNYSNDELNELLQELLENEDYEKAAQVRDELQRRKDEM